MSKNGETEVNVEQIYIVTREDLDGKEPVATFTDETKAEEFVAKKESEDGASWDYDTIDLNPSPDLW